MLVVSRVLEDLVSGTKTKSCNKAVTIIQEYCSGSYKGFSALSQELRAETVYIYNNKYSDVINFTGMDQAIWRK